MILRRPALRASDIPVAPGADEARTWLERELTDPVYHRGQSILQRILEWIGELFDGASRVGLPPGVAIPVVIGVLLVVLVVTAWVVGPVRRTRRAASARAVLDHDDRRTAAELRAAADAAAAGHLWALAVAERFRALVRSLEERTLLDERPGRTAHEAVEAALVRLPARTDDLRRAGRLFDDVVYGDVPAGADDDGWLRDAEQRVRDERPTLPGLVDAAGASGWPA
ncbi:DUF4129 domain-containing protein [Cellulomonas sp. P22]|uniref:DUF4129 domain-containing protein n=1 Tax=Cellulomonas sp. P22 TaxID=3373189 RepID=UPI0037B2CC66